MTFTADRTAVGSGSAEWGTPGDLFARLHAVYRFDYDAAAAHHNHLVPLYSTVDGTFECQHDPGPGCQRFMRYRDQVDDLDGLRHSWAGRRVYCNPPYSRGAIDEFVAKAYREREQAQLIVMLLPASTETAWFQRYVLPHCHIEWLSKRVHYLHPPFPCKPDCKHELGAPTDGPPGGSVVVTFKRDWMRESAQAALPFDLDADTATQPHGAPRASGACSEPSPDYPTDEAARMA